MIILNHEMFEQVMARANALAEEAFRRMVFDANMRPEAVELVRNRVVEALAERTIERWAKAANEELDKRDRRAPGRLRRPQ